ncbi:prealbumin-like fold domain-containing protein [Lacticaseibacillus manihotivorans]|uniref:prealbumin-like fold domain-containing protein n=1 Tax=Lacticaseibacillus manihotivorans TaxID=88233 RepID=UPI0006D20F4F|nr:prealbumin-like fold domain-containing protein [Lacticaseibacillus manihotivorans]
MVWTELTPPKPALVNAEFIKVDQFGKALKDVTFDLFADEAAQGVAIQTQTSSTDGTVTFTDVAPGDYWLKETNTPAGYVPLTQSIKITIQNDGTIKWPDDWDTGDKVVNKLKPWTIELEKNR